MSGNDDEKPPPYDNRDNDPPPGYSTVTSGGPNLSAPVAEGCRPAPANLGRSTRVTARVVANQPATASASSVPTPPNTWFNWSVFSLLCCFWPCGLLALVHSIKTTSYYKAGQYAAAESASQTAMVMNIVSLTLGIFLYVTLGIIIGVYTRSGVEIVTLLKTFPHFSGTALVQIPTPTGGEHQPKGWQQQKTSTGLTNAPPCDLESPAPRWGGPNLSAPFAEGYQPAPANLDRNTRVIVVTNQPAASSASFVPTPPNTWLAWSIFSTLCCAWPCGLLAIMYSMKTTSYYSAGQYSSAQSASLTALILNIVSLVLGICIYVSLGAVVGVYANIQ